MGCFCCPEQREESAGVTSGAREGPRDAPSAPLHRPHPPSATQSFLGLFQFESQGVELGARASVWHPPVGVVGICVQGACPLLQAHASSSGWSESQMSHRACL
ncbi:unnamed protein product, partial [Bubo scandiacus]